MQDQNKSYEFPKTLELYRGVLTELSEELGIDSHEYRLMNTNGGLHPDAVNTAIFNAFKAGYGAIQNNDSLKQEVIKLNIETKRLGTYESKKLNKDIATSGIHDIVSDIHASWENGLQLGMRYPECDIVGKYISTLSSEKKYI